MEQEAAMERIAELEKEVERLRTRGLSGNDRRYVEKLKADMRKAAAAREESEAAARELVLRMEHKDRRNGRTVAAMRAGCVDIDTLLLILDSGKSEDPSAAAVDPEIEIEAARERLPYLFRRTPHFPDTVPYFSVEPEMRPESPEKQAAKAYRVS